MKRFAALMLCIALLLTGLPGPAQAADTPKTDFTNYYLHYYDSSAEIQDFFMQALTQNTIKFRLDANIPSSKVALENGIILSNVPGHASLALGFNIKDRKAALDFKGSVAVYDIQGNVYFTEKGIIVPKSTIEALAANGASFPELGNINQLPEYVLYPSEIDPVAWNEIDIQLQTAQLNQEQQIQAMRALLQEILSIIPNKCYYYSNNNPVLDLTKISLDSPELLNSLKEHSETLADKTVAVMTNPGNVDTQEWEAMKDTTRKQIIMGINSLSSDDMANAVKEIPFDLEKCNIRINNDRCETSLAIKANLPDETKMSFQIQDTSSISSGTTNSSTSGNFNLRSSELNLDIDVNGNSWLNKSQGQFTLNLAGSGTDNKNTISGKLGLSGSLDWSRKDPVWVPIVNSANSKTVKRPKNNYQQPIRLYLYGEEISFTGRPPWISEGNTMVQLNCLADALGYTVNWQEPDTIVISNGSSEDLTLYLNSTRYLIGSQEYQSNAAVVVIEGRTYVPLRVLTDYYNLTVEWDPETQTINLHQV